MELIEAILYAYFGLLAIAGLAVILRFITALFAEEKA